MTSFVGDQRKTDFNNYYVFKTKLSTIKSPCEKLKNNRSTSHLAGKWSNSDHIAKKKSME